MAGHVQIAIREILESNENEYLNRTDSDRILLTVILWCKVRFQRVGSSSSGMRSATRVLPALVTLYGRTRHVRHYCIVGIS